MDTDQFLLDGTCAQYLGKQRRISGTVFRLPKTDRRNRRLIRFPAIIVTANGVPGCIVFTAIVTMAATRDEYRPVVCLNVHSLVGVTEGAHMRVVHVSDDGTRRTIVFWSERWAQRNIRVPIRVQFLQLQECGFQQGDEALCALLLAQKKG